MKSKLWSLSLLLLCAAMSLSGCAGSTTPDNRTISVAVSQDDLDSQTEITRPVEISLTNTLAVSLPANSGSTGFSWTEAMVSDTLVIAQSERNDIAAASGMPGASGKTVWTFKPVKAGHATITMEYSRPWEGGEKGVKTFTLTVTVK